MIRAITIDGYKSYNRFSLKLTPLAVLFGPNAAGKSNFLDALQLLSRMATSRVLKDAFEFPYRGKTVESFSFPPKGIEGILEEESVSFRMTVDVELSESLMARVNKEIRDMRKGLESENVEKPRIAVTEKFLRYSIHVEFMPKQGYLRVKDESLSALRKDMKGVKESRGAFLCRMNNAQRLSLRVEGQAHPTYYDLGMDHTVLTTPLYAPHYPHITAFKRELEGWRFFYFEPRVLMRQSVPAKETHHIGPMGEDLATFIHGLRLDPLKAGKFKSLCRALKTLIPTIDSIDTQVDKNGEVELFVIENGRPISSRLMSEGTLRLLGLLTIAGDRDNATVVCFEEPENGVNPRKIKQIAEFLKRTAVGDIQVIVTTHSPVLPDQIPNESLYICRRKDGITEILPFTASGLFRKSEIDTGLDEEAPLPSELIMRGDLDA